MYIRVLSFRLASIEREKKKLKDRRRERKSDGYINKMKERNKKIET